MHRPSKVFGPKRTSVRFLLLIMVSLCGQGTLWAAAGPNQEGVLILYTDSQARSFDCDSLALSPCNSLVLESSADSAVVFLVAVFPDSVNPRVAGVEFGLAYNLAALSVEEIDRCGDFSITTADWPGPGSGIATVWTSTRTSRVIPIGAFLLRRNGTANAALHIVPHPVQGLYFADDSIPSKLDPIVCTGSFGLGEPGYGCCNRTPAMVPIAAQSSAFVVFPNPSDGGVTIRFRVESRQRTRIDTYAATGRQIGTVLDEVVAPGFHDLEFDLSLPAGAYYLVVRQVGRPVSSSALTILH